MSKKVKLNDSQKAVLLAAMDQLDYLQSKIDHKTIDNKVVLKDDDGGLPSENVDYKGMSYIEALYKARQMENDAIEINLYLLEIAPESDSKTFIEIATDENDHDKIYAKIIEREEKK